jgi:hypothetical protein
LAGALLTATITAACGTTVPLSHQVTTGVSTPSGELGVSAPGVPPAVVTADGTPAASDRIPGQQAGGQGSPASTSGSGGTTGATGTTGSSGSAGAAIPTTGPGWDAKNIYLGFPTENDASTATAALGFQNVYFGDPEGNVRAVLASINAKGGVFGRQVVPVFHDNSTAQLLTDPNTAAQSNCSYFTQDKRVAAVVNLLVFLDIDSFRECMAKARIPVFAAGQITDDVVLRQLGGLYLNLAASYTPYTPVLVSSLKRQGFFSGWDASAAKATAGAPKVGVLIYAAGATEKRVGQLFLKALKDAGYPVADTFEYIDVTGSQMSNAVLKFRADGITHVFDYTAAIVQFMRTADQQRYRPRYALVSSMGPRDVIAGQAPNSQLVGSMGLGFCPVCEVPGVKDPDDSPGAASCRADLAKAGLRYESEPKRSALGIAYATCDGIKLLTQAFVAGGGFTSAQTVAGLDRVGRGFATARTFRSSISSTRPAVPSLARDFAWDPGCACFAYGRGTTVIP